jgi:DeoR/GlpR family transcriptional regulator of sugar metabolism
MVELKNKLYQLYKFALCGMKIMQSEFLSIKELAVIFSVNQITIRRAIQKGLIIAIKIGDGKRSPYRISKKSIQHIHDTIILQHEQIARKRFEEKK